jgi:spore coat polysaccharide biosynthesis protein SpsF (cytidylyltransferase family)/RimJ/RimL family protein N-acetyltransferase
VLLEWRNDETTRRFSFSEDVVQWDDHVQWLERTLADATSRLWIAEVDGAPVGQIRAQRGAGGIAELHLAVAPDARGRGLAAAMIGAAALAAGRELGVRRLLGRVKADNARSQRAFARAGFAADGEEHWVRDLVPGPVVTVVQARMGSTRLPGKVLADLGGRPMLALLLDRVTRAGTVDAVVVATTVEPRDDAIADLAAAAGVPVFRGSEADVLGRFEGAADLAGAGTVVRVTADCPLVAPEGIDLVVGALGGEAADLATNSPPTGRTWPDGLDVEAFTRKALTRAAAAADDPSDREHVTRWFHTSGEARVAVVDLDPPLGNMRITIDTAADLELVRGVLERLGGRTDFTLDELLAAALVRPAE